MVYIEKCGATLLVGAWQRGNQQNKLVERKPFVDTQPRSQGHFPGLRAGREKTLGTRLVDTVRIKSADLKNKFSF